MTKGSWARFGIQQTPLLDFEESIYRYRFQGTTFTEREGFYNSADAGASFHYNLPKNYGDVHVGVYNGEGYARPEVNDQKAVEVRGTVRPLAEAAPLLRGLRVTGFYFADHYMKDAERTRAVGEITFESSISTPASMPSLRTTSRPSGPPTSSRAAGRGGRRRGCRSNRPPRWKRCCGTTTCSRTPRRQPTHANDRRPRVLVPEPGALQSALMLDYDGQTFQNFVTPQPAQKRIAVHGLINLRGARMKNRRLAATIAATLATRRGPRRADDSNQRRRRDVSVSDLLEVVRRVQQAAPERARSTISRSAPAAASGRCRRRRSSSARPTAR